MLDEIDLERAIYDVDYRRTVIQHLKQRPKDLRGQPDETPLPKPDSTAERT